MGDDIEARTRSDTATRGSGSSAPSKSESEDLMRDEEEEAEEDDGFGTVNKKDEPKPVEKKVCALLVIAKVCGVLIFDNYNRCAL